ncbi:toluene tolerance family protein [Alkalidesulfovibrio alkalitolerans DSM 16529]|uniref:Toluene tolerance family protein n=1 Tax=Alkalidesulfovibrio alkalitolerans DSM 16529 TaxID=1121439 RepID=S7UGP0_9BACT|nr:ABC transporter substrate-binding protein [Alkalidesulfovibrio alkalitolerans]EPR32999.1 toluene tolerance family protein [Alkalidesulfovibrio alkalitolerans DSM 16529]
MSVQVFVSAPGVRTSRLRGVWRLLAACLVAAVCLTPAPAMAEKPMDAMKDFVGKVLDVLRDPAFKDGAMRQEQRNKLSALADDIFDWVELSRRTLALNWNRLDSDQRRDFVELYKQLLERTYMDRIQDYKDEEVVFSGQSSLSDTQVEIQTTVRSQGKNIPINYRLINRADSWRIYDVQVEGVSLVQNYRTQFNNILASKSPDEMIEDLRRKVAEGA